MSNYMLSYVYKQIVAAKYGYASIPMHPAWTMAFKESNENFVVEQIPWRLCQIQSEKEVVR